MRRQWADNSVCSPEKLVAEEAGDRNLRAPALLRILRALEVFATPCCDVLSLDTPV